MALSCGVIGSLKQVIWWTQAGPVAELSGQAGHPQRRKHYTERKLRLSLQQAAAWSLGPASGPSSRTFPCRTVSEGRASPEAPPAPRHQMAGLGEHLLSPEHRGHLSSGPAKLTGIRETSRAGRVWCDPASVGSYLRRGRQGALPAPCPSGAPILSPMRLCKRQTH